METGTIYKLLTRGEWETALADGVYSGSTHDWRDGFIHFSTAAQLADTARKYFAGEPDLVLLTVDVGALKKLPSSCTSPQEEKAPLNSPQPNCDGSPSLPHPTGERAAVPSPSPIGERARVRGGLLHWELARGGDLFPHLYGDLQLYAVKSVTAIPLATDGIPILPSELQP
jgi:uncharacterized protein (DUF952 family)